MTIPNSYLILYSEFIDKNKYLTSGWLQRHFTFAEQSWAGKRET